ncbi:hypothetical protein [Bacillus canaveralius]|uniref:hypothetical protein n=1 Tax=Bacillus canaveralius TaxID=1403243 RepID=UPI0027E581C7|nr:hypothetical protein [Bacillus canaveralius]
MTSKDITISAAVDEVIKKLLTKNRVKTGLDFIKLDNDQTLLDQIKLTEIPAPTFQEQQRAAYFENRLKNIRVTGCADR